MIIVSQDKKRIFNFDNIMYIEITENKTTIRCQQGNENIWLGNYKTEERAEEVLEEIINAISVNGFKNIKYEEADLIMKFKKMTRYEMPKE